MIFISWNAIFLWKVPLSDTVQAELDRAYEHTDWVLGYQSIARYDEDTDTIIILFVNSTGDDTEMTISLVYNRVARIVHR